MPSAHAQFMGFFFTYLTLRLWLQWRGLTQWHRLLGTGALASVSMAVMFARVYLWYHNVPQVAVGASIGCALGATFFLAGTVVRVLGLTDWVLSWRISTRLSLKDSCYSHPLSLEQERVLWLKRRAAKSD